jgi:imidazolonepropionase-like amidohydrolase
MNATAATLTGLRIWDGFSSDYVPGCDAIAVENGRIRAIGSADALLGSGEVRDFGGAVVIPGLIDAHVHLCLDPDIRDPSLQSRGTRDEELAAMAARAHGMARAGITTARDLGGGQHLELALRDRIRDGALPGPRLLCAGQPVTSVRGHCHFWGGEAADLDAARAVIARQAAAGVDLVKVMATGGSMTAGTRPRDAQFDDATLAAIVAEARGRGYAVAAHCPGTAGIRGAVGAGVTTIEHCSWVGESGWGSDYDADAAAAIAARGIWVSPTINAGWQRFVGREDDFATRVSTNLKAMRALGVRYVASTDAGIPNVRHADLPKALPVFAHFAGLTPVEALRSATSESAQALGIDDLTGTLTPGFAADLVVVDGDPLADLACLARPVAVMTRGSWVT